MYFKKKYVIPILLGLLTLCGCSEIGSKSISPSSIYIATTIMSFIAGIIYCSTIKSKSVWFLLMFASIFIVNIGYLSLSISTILEEALLANRIAYFGSVFLPLSLFMSILEMLKIKHPKWLSYVLVSLSIFIFLVAASPGYLDIYYQDVTLEIINGTAILRKVYGPWHSIYLFYLLGYFASMIIVVLYTERIKHVTSQIDAFFLLTAVFVNIGVWLLEQFVKIDFEILSISYIISELFLLILAFLHQSHDLFKEQEKDATIPHSIATTQETCAKVKEEHPYLESTFTNEQIMLFQQGVNELTKTERMIFDAYIQGKSTKEILNDLNIKENTLKFHNKNLYGKLYVSSRKNLLELYKYITILNHES